MIVTRGDGRCFDGYTRPAVAGSGTIACGLAACASQTGAVRLLARSDASAWRAEEAAQAEAKKLDAGASDRIKATTVAADLAGCDVIVEAIVEDRAAKGELLYVMIGLLASLAGIASLRLFEKGRIETALRNTTFVAAGLFFVGAYWVTSRLDVFGGRALRSARTLLGGADRDAGRHPDRPRRPSTTLPGPGPIASRGQRDRSRPPTSSPGLAVGMESVVAADRCSSAPRIWVSLASRGPLRHRASPRSACSRPSA